MSFKDWINYILKRMVWFVETPKEERKALRKRNKERWSSKWFGLLPFAIRVSAKKVRKRFDN